MLDQIVRLFAARPLSEVLRDLLDIVVVAWVIYRALLVLRGTRAIQMAVGLAIVVLVYLGAKVLHLATLQNLLSSLLSSIVLIVVVVFQNDIRRALIRMGGTAWFTGGREQQSRVIDEVVAAATELARHRMGALIAFEQDANVLEFVKSDGIQLDCVVTRELLVSLFVPESVNKLHDGAVLIRDLKIARAGVFFPMPDTKILDAQLGSRHRAALGITEETDAVVVVVSEERGTISFCFSGNIVSNLDGQSLRHALLGLFGRSARKKRPPKKATTQPPVPAPVTATPYRTSGPLSTGRAAITHPPPAITGGPGKTAAAKIPTSMPMRSSADSPTPAPDASLLPKSEARANTPPAAAAKTATFVPMPQKQAATGSPLPGAKPQAEEGRQTPTEASAQTKRAEPVDQPDGRPRASVDDQPDGRPRASVDDQPDGRPRASVDDDEDDGDGPDAKRDPLAAVKSPDDEGAHGETRASSPEDA